MKINKLLYAFILIVLGVICIACTKFESENGNPRPIKELAYDENGKENYVYIKENNEYEAYMVLSKDYYGKTLLMRKFLLDEPRAFNIYERNGAHNAYYPNSLMDVFLSKATFIPPGGCPISPRKNSTTDCGKSSCAPCSMTDDSSKLFCTMKSAMSPTTLDDGVTLMISPNNKLTR